MNWRLELASVVPREILRCGWNKHELGEELPSWREYCRNVADKLKDADYRSGMDALLRPGVTFDPDEAWANVRANIVDRLMTDVDRAELSMALKTCSII